MTQQLIPFDLAKACAGHPLVTRDGRKVTEFHRFETLNKDKCVAVIDGKAFMFADRGRWDQFDDCGYDLFIAPTEVTMWVNVYLKNSHNDFEPYYTDGFLWKTEERAKSASPTKPITATVPVTFFNWNP
jgi:hypothetical protein